MALVVRLIGLVVDDLAHSKVIEKFQARIAWPMRHVHYSVAPVGKSELKSLDASPHFSVNGVATVAVEHFLLVPCAFSASVTVTVSVACCNDRIIANDDRSALLLKAPGLLGGLPCHVHKAPVPFPIVYINKAIHERQDRPSLCKCLGTRFQFLYNTDVVVCSALIFALPELVKRPFIEVQIEC